MVETQINRRLGGCQVTLAELIENTILTARDGYRISLELIRDRVLDRRKADRFVGSFKTFQVLMYSVQ